MFCAGVILNLSLLESVSRDYFLIAHPASLLAAIGLCILFLCLAVLLLPAKLIAGSGNSFAQTVEESIGARAAWVFQNLVVTVWAAGWFSSISWYAVYGLSGPCIAGRSRVRNGVWHLPSGSPCSGS